MKAKVLITGMAGLLGSNFSRHLLAEGYDVVGIDDFSGGYKENLADGAKCVNINLADLEAVDRFFVMKSRIMSIILPLMPPRG